MSKHDGGCHCGAVRFRVEITEFEAVQCNCSICIPKGFLHLLVEADQFEALHEPEALSEYRFGTEVARHLFCRMCGIHPYYVPRSNPDGFSVNVRCLDDADIRARFEVRTFDGQHWEDAIGSLA